ncbi:MAG TPA: GAF domain-containing sensor histidine kinase [Acidimicrobiales bacterium]|nr:GAF domain-containing sensor histidine kinase [Acidimicrobiales bacterium]
MVSREQKAGADLAPLATVMRWGTLSLAVLTTLGVHGTRRDVVLATALVIYASLRTVQPLPPAERAGELLVALAVEALLGLSVVALSGGWESPFLLTLGATLVIGGLEGGWRAVAVTTTVLLAGAAALAAGGARVVAGSAAVERVAALGMVGAVGAYARWVLRSGDDEREEEVNRLRSAHEVNSLLLELYARVAGGPVSLSLQGALQDTVERLRAVLAPDVVALLLADPDAGPSAEGAWQTVAAQGAQLPVAPSGPELPPVLAEAIASPGPILYPCLGAGEGLGPRSASGVYAALRCEDRLIGVLAVERRGGAPGFSADDAEVAAEVARHGALAIENARWFGRLRMLGAAAERGRIARELHDRVGQSLAAASFGLDAVAGRVEADAGAPDGLAAELRDLSEELHTATRGVREELADLRTDTSAGTGLPGTLGDLLERVRTRSGVETELHCDASGRPRPAVEHEIWRIAQEAVLNAERHSGATRIAVRWHRQGGRSVLEVADDGRGLDASAPARADAYGLVGMRERADAIGGQLTVASPGAGTTVRLKLEEDL